MDLITTYFEGDGASTAAVAAQLKKKNPDPIACMLSMMFAVNTGQVNRDKELQQQILDLTKENKELKEENQELSDRLLRAEAYSGRATSILTNVPQPAGNNEDTVAVVTGVVKKIIPDFTRERISVAHRNKQRSDNKPRSITVVFTHIRDKDIVSDFRKQQPLRPNKIGVYHYTPKSVLERKLQLQELERVEKIYYDGPNRMFSVKLVGEEKFRRNVVTRNDIMN
eukprot:sb/3469656/